MEQNLERGMWRGKDIKTGEWVVGWRVPGPDAGSVCLVWAEPEEYENEKGTHSWLEFDGYFEVDPSTLGEYTGKMVKSGPVFQNDIGISIDGLFLVRWSEEKSAFVINFYDYPREELYIEEMYDDSKIIGNLIDNQDLLDNPELLGGTE